MVGIAILGKEPLFSFWNSTTFCETCSLVPSSGDLLRCAGLRRDQDCVRGGFTQSLVVFFTGCRAAITTTGGGATTVGLAVCRRAGAQPGLQQWRALAAAGYSR